MKTFGQLKTDERAVLWPSPGEPRNLVTAHNRFFEEGMTQLSKWVKCLQDNNTSIFEKCSSFVRCAKTVVPAPNGIISRVYTVANDGFCDPVYYRSRSYAEVEVWGREAMVRWTTPVNTALEPLPEGFAYPDDSNDGHCGRALIGIWAIHRGHLYVAPWLESNEKLVIEWDGPKEEWKDDEIIDTAIWDIPARAALRAYVKWQHSRHYGCDRQATRDDEADYRRQLADLMDACEKRTEQQHEENVPDIQRYQTRAEAVAAEVPDPEDTTIVVANIGDYGNDDANELAVSELVKGWGPDAIVTNGDNTYNSDYDEDVGKYYSDYIYPYSGAHGDGAAENLFFPSLGNHDYDTDDEEDLRSYLAFFSGLPGNKRYYEKVLGSAHFFILNSQAEEPDGNTATGAQAMWLKAKMSLSPARWKVVVIHDSPYTSSEDTPGILASRWPFFTWGADLVLSGDAHGYERFSIDGKPYIVNGAGGRTITTFGTPVTGSQIIYAGFGAGKITIGCDELKYEFFDVNGVLKDTLTLT